jgi:aminoglycoside phosphotransferase family enzyme
MSNKNSIEMLKIINYQRILSQQITKAYLYTQNGLVIEEANREIKDSIIGLKNSYKKVTKLTKNKKIKNTMNSIAKQSTEFNKLLKKPLSSQNIDSILKLSESILNQSEEVVSILKKSTRHKDFEFISLLGQQGMLAQRIAKYYIAYKSNKSINTKQNIEKSIALFNKNHKKLMRYKTKNPSIKRQLNQIDKLWKISYKIYKDMEKNGDVPLIVFESTDNITSEMNKLIKIYTSQIK